MLDWLSEVPWGTVLIVAVILILLVVAIVLIVRWRRKRSARAQPDAQGPSTASKIGSIWRPFYQRIPRRARHYPTFVVMGEAGVGKTHLITSRVDWEGQAKQYNPSAYRGTSLQLYLGPEVVVHELSAPLLHDTSRSAKRALTAMWKHMGPSATVVVVLDARTLATTAEADFRALAQLVRGKIGLFPRRGQESLDVRVALTHLDQMDGYEEFASVVGTHESGMSTDLLGPDYVDADHLVGAFDSHLAYALTTREGPEFARLVGFYDSLAALVRTLPPLLRALRGDDDRFATPYPPSELYLGSVVPHSYVGDPFTADPELVVASIERYDQRGVRWALLTGAILLAASASISAWHVSRITDAEEAVEHLVSTEDESISVSVEERHAAQDATEDIERMFGSEMLWTRWLYVDRKTEVEHRFADTIRTFHLLPWLERPTRCREGEQHDEELHDHTGVERPECAYDRLVLLYAVSLIYASRDDELGELIGDNALAWAERLSLTDQIVTYYIQASRERWSVVVDLPKDDEIVPSGQEWTLYLRHLCEAFERQTIPEDEVRDLSRVPLLLSASQYEALERAREILRADEFLGPRLGRLLTGELDSQWAVDNHGELSDLSADLDELLRIPPTRTKGWGLEDLKMGLERIELLRQGQSSGRKYELSGSPCSFDVDAAASVMARTRAKGVIHDALEGLSYERRSNGKAFFSESEALADVGAIQGYGGAATETIDGFYTKSAFEDHVAPVLDYAANVLSQRELDGEDRVRVERTIREVAGAYASAYRDALVTYYQGFEFRPGSEVALPFALKPLTQPSSWFTDFLTTVSHNATMTLPDNEYYEPMTQALQVFEPLNALLAEDKGAIPGLEPYAAIVGGLIPLMEDAGAAGGGEAAAEDGLEARLSPLGLLVLHTHDGTEVDRREQVSQWLQGAGVDYTWHEPFDIPVELVYRYGAQNVEDEVEEAWQTEVRPVLVPLLARYPFDGAAEEEAAIADIEAVMLKQGKEPGQFWERFELLIAPATRVRRGRYVMIPEVYAPLGMLDLVHDVQDLSSTLWDADGARIPIPVQITPKALPAKAYDGRVASMAYLRSGGSAVYAFNQRPEAQTLELRWWEQGTSMVSLKMTVTGGEDSREFTTEEGGSAFSFYRLLDQARSCEGRTCRKRAEDETTLTRWAVSRGKGCGRWAARGTTGLPVRWSVVLDAKGKVRRPVRFVLDSDPWAPWVLRDCPQ